MKKYLAAAVAVGLAAIFSTSEAAAKTYPYKGLFSCDRTDVKSALVALSTGKSYTSKTGYIEYQGKLIMSKTKGSRLLVFGQKGYNGFAFPATKTHGWIFAKTEQTATKTYLGLKRYTGSAYMDVLVCAYKTATVKAGSYYTGSASALIPVFAKSMAVEKDSIIQATNYMTATDRLKNKTLYYMMLVSPRSKLYSCKYKVYGGQYVK